MWNPKLNRYVLSSARVDAAPVNDYDITRLEDIKNYFSVSGYNSGTVGYINANENNFIPPFINLSKGDSLMLPDNLPNLSFDLYFNGFYKTQSASSLNYEVCLIYFDKDMNFLNNSVSYPVINDEIDIDIEVRATGFEYPINTKYIHIGFKNNSSDSLKIIYNYSNVSVKVSQEQKDETLLKTVENPLFVLLGGLGGTPAPQPIPQNLEINSLTLDSSLTIKNGNNSGVIVLNQDGDFQVNSGNINMYNKKVTNIAYPSSAQDAASKNYVDTSITNIPTPDLSSYLKNSGDNTYTGILTISEGLALPLEKTLQLGQNNYIQTISNNDVRIYKGDNYLALTDGNIYTDLILNMMDNNIINLLDPVRPQDAATKAYVDAHSGGSNVGPENLTSSTLKLDYVQGQVNDNSQNSISFYNKGIIGFPMFQIGFNNSDSTFQVFSANELTVGCNQNNIIFQEGNNGSGGDISIQGNNPIKFLGYTGKQQIDIQQAIIEDLPTQDNHSATKKYVDDSIQTKHAIFGQFQAFRNLTSFTTGNSTRQEFMTINFPFGPVPNENQKLLFSMNLSQFSLSHSMSFDISYKVNNESEVTFFSRTQDIQNTPYSTPLTVSGLIDTVTYPISISLGFYNYSNSNINLTTLSGIPVNCNLEAVTTGSSVFSVSL